MSRPPNRSRSSTFSLENHSYQIAAVDVAAYRRFTGRPRTARRSRTPGTASPDGEIAVLDTLKRRIPLDKDGYLAVGSGEQTAPIHVGAWTAQVGTIDAVVNTAWGKALDLPENNALVINTGGFSPQAVKKKLKKVDATSRSPTSTSSPSTASTRVPVQTAQFVGTFAEAVGVFRYTPIGGGRVAARGLLGADAHRDRRGAAPRLGHLQQVHDAAAARGAARGAGLAAWLPRSTG